MYPLCRLISCPEKMRTSFRQWPFIILILFCLAFLAFYIFARFGPAQIDAAELASSADSPEQPAQGISEMSSFASPEPTVQPSSEPQSSAATGIVSLVGSDDLSRIADELAAVSEQPSGPSEEDLLLQASLRISEAMPANGGTLLDEDGDSSDWLEIVNIGLEEVSLENCRLSDRAKNLGKWCFPDVRLAPGERLLVFCSRKNRADGELHTNFGLSKAGGEIYLSSPGGLLLDAVSYEKAEKDHSLVFRSDSDTEQPSSAVDDPAASVVAVTWEVSPGFPNNEEGFEAWLESSDHPGDLVISEAVSHNTSYGPQQMHYYDWVEFKNNGDTPLDLHDYYLSDDDRILEKCRLPERVLQPGEYFVVFCSGNAGLTFGNFRHIDLAIGTDERLWLTDSSGTVSDCLWVHDIPEGASIGRMDGYSGPFFFEDPTPYEANGSGCRLITRAPSASVAQGVYNGVETLETELSGSGTIYYTLDGSVPDTDDIRYDGPIRFQSTGVLRAVCVEEGKLTGGPATFSYIINENDSLPVTSLVCDPAEMFGSSGVYKAVENRDAKCDAAVSFFEENGSFSAGCSVELHGANSRNTFRKKSFELKFLNRTGGPVSYDLFGDGRVTEFRSLLLRGGSNVNLDTVRDCFASELIDRVCPALYPQDVRYTAVYINGEYYGVYAWREAYSEDYFASHTGMPAENVVMDRAPLSYGELYELFQYVGTRMSPNDEEYAYISDLFDVDSLAGWMVMQAWFNNLDINGNIRYVKPGENAKWQMILYDLDYSLLTEDTGWDVMMNSYQLNVVMKSLLSRPEFRELLLQKAADMVGKGFTTEGVLSVFDGLLIPLDEPTVRKDCSRWNEDYGQWLHNLDALRSHLTDARMQHWLQGLQNLARASAEDMHSLFPEYYP